MITLKIPRPSCQRKLSRARVGRSFMKFDHHIHTCRHSPDSDIDPRKLVDFARKIGLDGVVIPDPLRAERVVASDPEPR